MVEFLAEETNEQSAAADTLLKEWATAKVELASSLSGAKMCGDITAKLDAMTSTANTSYTKYVAEVLSECFYSHFVGRGAFCLSFFVRGIVFFASRRSGFDRCGDSKDEEI